MEITTILIKKETRDMLKEFGKKSETYDDLLRRLLRECKQNVTGAEKQ